MLKTVVGHSNDPDSLSAITEVLEQCQQSLSKASPQAGILFAAIDFEHTLILNQINETYPGIELIGGTTDGEMSSILGFEQDSLTLMLFCSDTIAIRAGIGRDISQDLNTAIQTAVFQATTGNTEEIKLCITLPESLSTSAVLTLDSLNQALGGKIPIFGGLTADRWQFKQTYQFYKTEVLSDAIPILLISGSILFSHSIASGWHPIGKRGKVTKASQNVIYEIDDKPALEFYHHYLGKMPPSSEYPLAIFDANETHYYMRAPSGVYDSEIGSVTFFGDIPEGAIVQITETTHDSILSASRTSMMQALENYPGKEPAAALYFSCASRRQILGTRTKEEYALTQTCLSQALPSCGFYTNGEISPLEDRGISYFHNETFVTLLLGEV
ncbi:FIST C-terminal domain-containing protein [Microcoleus sp. LEGE 07076]|uniref:FIST signal transduction protein n=1 Tax=Microcoleus sp. LEGE 07076 TaxID=915322 RepID=UPI00187E9B35|nr:FIST N-terminal domain-containing protein [Microcoleus sp. LEGE 07076]MBE9187147.1 FIST C-terminal domain-containing protein [Microcoleus sp. LEGE 07076]